MSYERNYWINTMCKIAKPVLFHLSKQELKEKMPVEGSEDRFAYAYLEALGRVLCGISPWLSLNSKSESKEMKSKERFAKMARQSIESATDPESPDYMNFYDGDQPLVDTAFLSQAVVRAPGELYDKLSYSAKQNLIRALKMSRKIKPYFCNWLLFSAMVETALYIMGEEYDPVRVDYALKQHEQWYKGDGIYGDGPEFHWDYYNSYVIQPMLIDIINALGKQEKEWYIMKEKIYKRARRYSGILERLISPEGTFPPLGRSLSYRFGAFHLLSQMALIHNLPEYIKPAQVRCALTAIIKNMVEADGTFDDKGWLRVGFCGYQIDLAEKYISTGSLYHCLTVFLPVGLSADDEFWSGKTHKWTSQKIWSGENLKKDISIE
ncbi:MAG TPA: DUF2264 domain-containing protein [Halanaerobiales bacterium]|nr:DUF2264 domain-containing protein [Halanaerobiales bacterium]